MIIEIEKTIAKNKYSCREITKAQPVTYGRTLNAINLSTDKDGSELAKGHRCMAVLMAAPTPAGDIDFHAVILESGN